MLTEQGHHDYRVVSETSQAGRQWDGPPPYRQLTEVSLIMNGPGIRPGQTTHALTNHIDLTPTLLDISGVLI